MRGSDTEGFMVRIRFEEHRSPARQAPTFGGFQRRRSMAAILRRFAGPLDPPALVLERGQERLRRASQERLHTEVHDQEAVAARRSEEADEKSVGRKHGAIDSRGMMKG